ncbi:glycerophosphodiester phosphodiesterase family protein [Roseburia hominis]
MFLFIIILGILIGSILLYLYLIMPNLTRRRDMVPFLGRDYAHRGLHNANALVPENSMPAFKEAVKRNLAIELDIHITRDNQVVVFHDDTLDRICGVPGTIEEYTLAELRNLHLLGTAERIPLFSDVLDYIDGRVPLLVELKLPSRDMRLCAYAWELLKDYRGKFLIQSFNTLGVRWFYKNAPHILRGQLSSALTRSDRKPHYLFRLCVQFLLTNILCRPDFISYKLADSENLSLLLVHRLFHTPIAVWTLRTPKAYQKAHHQFDMYIFELPAKTASYTH